MKRFFTYSSPIIALILCFFSSKAIPNLWANHIFNNEVVTQVSPTTCKVSYSVTVTEVQWFEGGINGACQETGDEEYSAKAWFDDDIDGTDIGGNCFQCENNGDCTITPNLLLGERMNSDATIINIFFHAWEDDIDGRCSYDYSGSIFNNEDDCGCEVTTVANISFRNSNPGCTTYGSFGCNSNHNLKVEICWDYITPQFTQLTVTDTIPDNLYQASDSLTSDGIVLDSANVSFKAGETILLDTGFTVLPGANFSAEIENCGL